MYNPKCQIPALRFSNQHNYKLLWEREKEKGIMAQIAFKIRSLNQFPVMLTAAGSEIQRWHTQMQDIKSLYPVPTEMWSTTHGPGVSTMKPQVTGRMLLFLTSAWLHSNRDSFSRDLGFCTLKTG